MNVTDSPPDFSRVVVAVGAAMPGHAAVAAAVDLAAAVGAVLEGLFVENEELLRVSALPHARETSVLTGTRRGLALVDLERAFRIEAARLERLLAERAAQTSITWSFTVARGGLSNQALARDAELIVVESAGCATARPQLPRAGGPIMIAFDATPAAQRGLAAMTRLARRTGRALVILVPAGNAASGPSVKRRAESWLAAQRIEGSVLPIPFRRDDVMTLARSRRSALLVLPVPVASAWSEDIALLADAAPCPLVIAR